MAKHVIRLFGFAIHDAPGEAEAECALLQQQGIVDAVLSEDVDTIMFGCRKTLRNWSAEGQKGSKTPTHVSMFDAATVAAGASGLDREGMVLVALMSGGDYLPEGVPGCGVKVACEAARAGFGRDLCRIKKADRDGLVAWKQRLLHELRTNESGFFRTKHKALEIPESFPNMEILRYYTHPVVSREATIDRLRTEFPRSSTVDVAGLREFTRTTFDWGFRGGAYKLVRVLAPSLLVQRFLERYISLKAGQDDLVLKRKEESRLVRAISSKRAHFSTDATPELRISFVPADIVKLDLEAEPEQEVEGYGRSGIALNSDDEFDEEPVEEIDGEQPKSSSAKKAFDPFQPDLVWIPEALAKLGVPLTVEDWEEKQRLKAQRVAAKGTRNTRTKKTDMPVGALDKYVKVTRIVAASTAKDPPDPKLDLPPSRLSYPSNLPAPRGRSKQSKKASASSQAQPSAEVNPWTLANSQASPRAGKHLPPPSSQAEPKPGGCSREPILLSSSPVVPAPCPAPGTGLTSNQTTPTKTKRLGHPAEPILSPAPLFDLAPSSRGQGAPALGKPAEGPGMRKARPFKRAKSGAGNNSKASTAQQSIKDFGRVGRAPNASKPTTKPDAVAEPIEILSDDDDFPLPPLTTKTASSVFHRSASPPRKYGFDMSDDDPFASPLPASRPPPARPSPAPTTSEISSLTKTKAGQPQPLGSNDLDTTTKAEGVLTAYNAPEFGKPNKRPSRRAWRLSELEVLDLTAED